MSHEDGSKCRDDCRACNNKLLGAVYIARRICVPVAVGAAILAIVGVTTWVPVCITAGVWIGITIGLWAPYFPLKIKGWSLRRQVERREEQIRTLRAEVEAAKQATHRARQERIQLEILASQLKTEIAQKQAYCSALRTENLEMERLMVQRKVEQVARETRQRLEIACAAVEADRLEAAAWRMELTVKQLELKLNQADLFESLSVIEDNAQERIIAAYEQGHDHGKRGIVIPIKHLRHLKVVEESA
ncbi:hypothetical protein [Streptomyces sp. NPDC051572]|uniref:hypothetical protein n=1 Tax=Streptomyces sp. NPDC051572 TaxID=3155802 RepID=UPI00344E17E3